MIIVLDCKPIVNQPGAELQIVWNGRWPFYLLILMVVEKKSLNPALICSVCHLWDRMNGHVFLDLESSDSRWPQRFYGGRMERPTTGDSNSHWSDYVAPPFVWIIESHQPAALVIGIHRISAPLSARRSWRLRSMSEATRGGVAEYIPIRWSRLHALLIRSGLFFVPACVRLLVSVIIQYSLASLDDQRRLQRTSQLLE